MVWYLVKDEQPWNAMLPLINVPTGTKFSPWVSRKQALLDLPIPLELGDKSSKISWALKLSDEITSSETKKFTCSQKALAFLYTNNEKSKREIKETIPFTIAMKRVIYLGINLPKETKDLYIENYKKMMKEIKDDIKDGEIYHVHGSEESI